MAENSRPRNIVIAIVLLIVVILLALLLPRCLREKPATPARDTPATQSGVAASNAPAPTPPSSTQPAEVLSPATLTVPERVTAGAMFAVGWEGPDNPGDFITIVPPDAPASVYKNYRDTKDGKTLELTAPIEPGTYEVRYSTARSKTILGRAPIEVVATGATIEAVNEVVLGTTFSVAWTGPNNAGDFITVVPKATPDGLYASYVDADTGSPQTLTAPTETGDAEVRYVTGQGRKVLARRTIKILMASVTLSAPGEAIAGTTISVTWTGPNNPGDYITVVSSDTPDGQYANYTNTASGSPLNLLLPIMEGDAELRYMTGQGSRVIARRPIRIVAAVVTLKAPPETKTDAEVSIIWTGPNNPGDYITIVPKGTPDGQYASYTMTSEGSPLNVKAPKEAGDAEIRYMTGQGNRVLARIAISVVP